jgi:hypothetical protein
MWNWKIERMHTAVPIRVHDRINRTKLVGFGSVRSRLIRHPTQKDKRCYPCEHHAERNPRDTGCFSRPCQQKYATSCCEQSYYSQAEEPSPARIGCALQVNPIAARVAQREVPESGLRSDNLFASGSCGNRAVASVGRNYSAAATNGREIEESCRHPNAMHGRGWLGWDASAP